MWKLLVILAVIKEESKPQEQLSFLALPLHKSHKLNVHKTFRGHSVCLLQLTFCIQGVTSKSRLRHQSGFQFELFGSTYHENIFIYRENKL